MFISVSDLTNNYIEFGDDKYENGGPYYQEKRRRSINR